jgi:oxygen-independent coproporphyrinogen-3 oxidase
LSEPLAGLYIHVPFCRRVCPYCDFAVRTGDAARRERYVEHLLAEARMQAGDAPRFDTIYFGGGTPSALAPELLARVVEALRELFSFAADTRIFLEANPEDVNEASVDAWRAVGVDTLSLGVQSFDDGDLAFLGRQHDAAGARRAVELARDAGFRTVSVDLIYGLPDQAAPDWRRRIEAALACGADHFSCYQLTIHERTRFHLLEKRGRLRQLADDAQAELFRVTHRTLEEAGYVGYEVSQFCREDRHRSRHNLKYWDHTPYLGLGPSAHSFRERRRWWNLRRTDPWQERIAAGESPVEETETLSERDLALEALMTGLRTHAGVDPAAIRERWGVDVAAPNAARVERYREDGLLRVEGERWVPTLDGLALADALAASFEV